jgi:hypothetical protein
VATRMMVSYCLMSACGAIRCGRGSEARHTGKAGGEREREGGGGSEGETQTAAQRTWSVCGSATACAGEAGGKVRPAGRTGDAGGECCTAVTATAGKLNTLGACWCDTLLSSSQYAKANSSSISASIWRRSSEAKEVDGAASVLACPLVRVRCNNVWIDPDFMLYGSAACRCASRCATVSLWGWADRISCRLSAQPRHPRPMTPLIPATAR